MVCKKLDWHLANPLRNLDFLENGTGNQPASPMRSSWVAVGAVGKPLARCSLWGSWFVSFQLHVGVFTTFLGANALYHECNMYIYIYISF